MMEGKVNPGDQPPPGATGEGDQPPPGEQEDTKGYGEDSAKAGEGDGPAPGDQPPPG